MRHTRGRSIQVRPLVRGEVSLPADLPVDPWRRGLYSVEELYSTPDYADSVDARAYAWAQEPAGRDDTLAQALHDHAVDEALSTWIRGRRLVGVMGGHRLRRGAPDYAEAARLGRALADPRGPALAVATGGGPGAMEAANLGALLAAEPDAALDDALELLGRSPGYHPSVQAWVNPALSILHATARPRPSLGIPTWHYGHEPTNLFATAIAKYFRNALREAILLEICDAGIVFLPGAAGTVQEVFQDACENYYAEESEVAPMVLLGRRYWTETVPVWPLLASLAQGRAMEPHVHLADSVEEAVELLQTSS